MITGSQEADDRLMIVRANQAWIAVNISYIVTSGE